MSSDKKTIHGVCTTDVDIVEDILNDYEINIDGMTNYMKYLYLVIILKKLDLLKDNVTLQNLETKFSEIYYFYHKKLELICFKIKYDDSIFIPDIEKIQPFSRKKDVNFHEDPLCSLSNQVINEILDLRSFDASCNSNIEELKDKICRIFKDKDSYNFDCLNLTKSKTELSENFLDSVYDYREIYSRDTDAFSGFLRGGENFNVDLHAVVLLSRGEYYGHIYAWISPIDPNMCFALGIRNRVDSIFIKGTDKEIKNVSKYLFEGVRKFALLNGANTISVDTPKQNVIPILRKIGFENNPIDGKLIGKSLSQNDYKCYTNMTYFDINKSLLIENIKFSEN